MRWVRLSQMKLIAGVMPVIRSHCRLRLSSRMLSLYSSLIVMLGNRVIGARRGSWSFCGSCVGDGAPNCGAMGTGCAAVSPGLRQPTSTAQVARARTVTAQRISYVADTREGLFRGPGVQALDRLMVVRQRRGLLDHVDRSELLHVFDLLGRRVTGDDHDGERWPQAAHLGHHVAPVHAGHRDVEKHRVEGDALETVQRLAAGVDHRRRVSLALERCRQHLGHLRLVVDNHDLHLFSSFYVSPTIFYELSTNKIPRKRGLERASACNR